MPVLLLLAAFVLGAGTLALRPPLLDPVRPNDNRVSAGAMRGDTLVIALEAKLAAWRPNPDVDSAITAEVFAEAGGVPQIPGPLVRVTAGTPVQVTLRNGLDSTLVVYGLRGGEFARDSVVLRPGETRVVAWTAGAPGTYMYWGTTTKSPVHDRPIRDSQLTGAMVIDAPGVPRDTSERIFVITVLDLFPQDTVRNRKKEDVFDRAINGLSWPHTERLTYPVGTRVKWRWVNGSYLPHPMHLHGFHFEVTGKGSRNRFTPYAPDARPTVVTELMLAGSTFDMEWTPTRGGRWLFHCHMTAHVVPFPARPDSIHAHDLHDLAKHPQRAMMGLVMGITVTDTGAATALVPATPKPLRLLAQRKAQVGKPPTAHGFVLQRGAEPARDSVEVPGAPLVLTRGRRSAITVVNRLDRPTSVHWHGMEIESVYDGVSGWSGSGTAMAPLIAPGDSFTVVMTPPRAGTFIYHTHLEEGPQLRTGMYGPLLVMEPGKRHDPRRDQLFIYGSVADTAGPKHALNGQRAPAAVTLAPGAHRFRIINIHMNEVVDFRLRSATGPIEWRMVARDGADLPPALVKTDTMFARLGVGETRDFEVVLPPGIEARLEAKLPLTPATITQVIRTTRR